MISYIEYIDQNINEALKIKSIKWKKNINGYTIDVNDSKIHSMIEKIDDRTHLGKKELRDKIYRGIEYIIMKDKKGFFDNLNTNRVSIGITYKISEFILSCLINTDEKYIRVNTILDKGMVYSHGIKWNLNEFQETFFDIGVHDNNTCFTFDDYLLEDHGSIFMVEPNERTNIPEVMLMEEITELTLNL